MTRPELVLFDLDDTLFAHREAVEDGILRHLAVVRGAFLAADPVAVQSLWRSLEEEHYHSYLAGVLDFHGQRRERSRDFAAAYGLRLTDTEATRWFERYFVHYRESWRLHADAMPCLDELAARIPGVRVGLITNGDRAFQSEKVHRVGLSDRVEHVIASGDLGYAKPDARIFRHACSVFGVAPGAAVYVGDRIRTDAIGAAEAGLAAVWIDRRAASVTEADSADAARLGVLRLAGLAPLAAALAP
ncbi:HAD family hydrolase [Cryobacterium psychrophilum]|uniref:HAD family hydrolase n=1 Tax=Cryobacterium psychrophilum TaxID=41988 RepID=A0A4Y8KRX6_9MICO|nr:HAD family hydrolase [Cryobacterium psychrophilum]TDW30642.1 putative hydrolase of the HAD superfamily [Cryobacterium psychrophilum]TFD77062.1 HAD family hydrolase [Cryobacterium psychrophilum]